MRYYLDTEFIDTGREIDLISIGIVCEDGRELYLQSADFNSSRASQWVHENVINHLKLCPHVPSPAHTTSIYTNKAFHSNWQGQCTFTHGENIIGAHTDCYWRTREQMEREVQAFLADPTELWGWCAAYDFVALCQLFGTMMDLPHGWPHYIRDLQQVLDERGIFDEELPPQEEGLHNALEDAKHIKKLWGYIVRNDAWQ